LKKVVLYIFLAGYIFMGPSPAISYEEFHPRGPMPIRNQMPMYLFWYFFPQEKAEVAGYKRFGAVFDYTVSNVITDKVSSPSEEYIVRMDMEVNRFNVNLKYGLMERLELAFEIPYLVTSKGYLDGFIKGFEEKIGATAVGARKHTDDFKYDYYVAHNYQILIQRSEPADGLGDMALAAKYMLMDEMGVLPRISARGALKFPTASESKYLGSGKYDAGAGVLLDKSLGRLFTFLNFNGVLISKPDCLKEMDLKNFILSGSIAAEYFFTERFSVIAQGTWNSTPYPTTGTDPLDNQAAEVGLGLNYKFTANSNWHIAVMENVFADSTPDVTFQLGGNIKF
jgi:hypothetical protein